MNKFYTKKTKCIICKKLGNEICDECADKIMKGRVWKKYDDNFCLYSYKDFRNSFIDYKFNGKKAYAKILAKIFLKNVNISEEYDIITYIPLSMRRYYERGFNQCKEILKHANIKTKRVLRKKHCKPQSNLTTYEERKANISNKFKVFKNIKDKKILLIDDIYTSGATITEAKDTLKLQGAKCVDTIIFMKS